MNKKVILSIVLVTVYFIMGVATSRMPRDIAYTGYDQGPLSINDSKHIIYFEDFNSNKNSWPEGRLIDAEYYFDKGHYVMSNKEDSKISIQDIVTDKKLDQSKDWIIEVAFTSMDLDSNAKASIIWGKRETNYLSYSFGIDGNAVLLDYGKNVEGSWVGGTKRINNFISKHKTVKLGVFKNNGELKYFLNKKFMFSGPLENFYGNEMAIAIEGNAKVLVDEIVIKQLQFRKKDNTYTTNRTSQDYSLENKDVIPMRKLGDYFLIPLTINGTISSNFIFDTWTPDVTVSEAMAKKIIKSGKVRDYIDDIEYNFQDGSKGTSARFIIEKLQIGERNVDKVECLILPTATHDVMVGRSVLSKFGKYEYNTERKVLLFEK